MDELYAPRDLGDGLVLRWSTPDDVENIGTLSGMVFRNAATDPPNEAEPAWIRDLASGRHPLTEPNRGIVVEDTREQKLVASLWAMRAPWRYGDVAFDIGRPEEVVADPAYRNRGLTRALLERFHAWSAAQGHPVQGITGIQYFYRQFGYEYAVDLGGDAVVMFADIPALAEGQTEPLSLRPATADDLAFITRLYRETQGNVLVSSDVPLSYWEWMLDGVDHASKQGWLPVVAVDPAQTPLGVCVLHAVRWGTALAVHSVLWEREQNIVAVIQPLVRALRAYAAQVPASRDPKEPDRIMFNVSAKDRFYDALTSLLPYQAEPPYAWYVRVPDLPLFITMIAPVLERRLRDSAVAGFDGELRLDFYRGGLLMKWDHGRFASAEPWRRVEWVNPPHARFPPLVFLQLLFGRRSLDDLRYAYADVRVERDADLALRTLFPTEPSHVLVLN